MKTIRFGGFFGRMIALAAVACGLALGVAPARAQVDYFLKVENPGITGQSVAAGFEGQIDIVSYNFSGNTQVEIQGPGFSEQATRFDPINVVLLLDAKALPALMQRVANGTTSGKITLTGRSLANETSFTFMKLELDEVRLTSVAVQGNSGDRPIVNVTMLPGQVKLTTTPQNPNGSPGTPVIFTWNYLNNVP